MTTTTPEQYETDREALARAFAAWLRARGDDAETRPVEESRMLFRRELRHWAADAYRMPCSVPVRGIARVAGVSLAEVCDHYTTSCE